MAVKKNRVSFTFSDEAVALLAKVAQAQNRSKANTLEVLILEKAKQLNITL